jgi:hypothetical protein
VAYIGTQITAGNYRKLTNLASSFNGVTTTFTLSVPPGTSPYYVTPTSTYQLLISVGGIIQQPDTDYTVSTNTITFTTAPAAGLSFFGILMGDALNIGTPSDGTVTTAKLLNGSVTTEKLASPISPAVSSLNGGQIGGNRNRIINGNFDIWQRGTSFTGSEYTADRWINTRVGTTHTASRQGFTPGENSVANEPTYYCRTIVTSVAGANNLSYLEQRIEDVRTFAGQQVTISLWARVDATKNISVELEQVFGTGGSPSASVQGIGVTKVSIGTSWQKVTVTATVPSISGKTLGSNNDHHLKLGIWFDAGSDFNSRTDSLGQQSGTFDIAQVQIEPGPVATPFERRSYGQELALCQRYFQFIQAGVRAYQLGGGTSAISSDYNFVTPMRAAPTIALISTLETGNVASIARDNASTTGFRFLALATSTGETTLRELLSASAEL